VNTGNTFVTGKTEPGNYTYYVTQTVNECQSAGTLAELEIRPVPEPPVSNSEQACSSDEIPLLAAAGDDIKWYVDEDPSNLVDEGNTFETGRTGPGNYRYFVTQTILDCESAATEVHLTIHDKAILFPVKDTSMLGNEVITLHAGDGFSHYEWYNGDTLSSLEIDGMKLDPGDHPVWLTATDINGCITTDTLIVTILNLTDIRLLKESASVQIFPNPTNGKLNVRFLDRDNGNVSISVLDPNGTIIILKKIDQAGENEIISLDLHSIPDGPYIIRLTDNHGTSYDKIIKIQ
jgi:hypothetical protein